MKSLNPIFKQLNSGYKLQLFVFVIFIFISRLPFLNTGYGVEEDSWGIAVAAHNTANTGVFEASRLPGHPVQELIYSQLWGAGPFVFNLLTAVFSVIAVLFFVLSSKSLGFKHYYFAGLAFAFTPVIYISSTYTIDYLWTMAFILGSFYFLIRGKIIPAGVLLGFAIGCRITSGIMLIPFSIIIVDKVTIRDNVKNIFKLFTPTLLVAFLTFIPVIKVYGWDFFMYYDQFPYPPITKVIYKAVFGVWGVIGFMAVLICFLIGFLRRKKLTERFLNSKFLKKKYFLVGALIIILYTISYLRLPQKSAYLIPLVPVIILFFGNYLNSYQFKFFCLSVILSSFLFSINLTDKNRGAEFSKFAFKANFSGQEIFLDPLSGPILSDYSKRQQKMDFTNKVLENGKNIQQKTLIIAGWWYNEIITELYDRKGNNKVEYVFYIDESGLKKYKEELYSIYYLPEQNLYNDQMFNMNCTNAFARALFP